MFCHSARVSPARFSPARASARDSSARGSSASHDISSLEADVVFTSTPAPLRPDFKASQLNIDVSDRKSESSSMYATPNPPSSPNYGTASQNSQLVPKISLSTNQNPLGVVFNDSGLSNLRQKLAPQQSQHTNATTTAALSLPQLPDITTFLESQHDRDVERTHNNLQQIPDILFHSQPSAPQVHTDRSRRPFCFSN